ncbi:hypothetical protein CspeluHIS016_0505560 [Cutaneotrichosporon spelunceum]|uniref:Autophagy-related protein 4 n=1 Tax=Cutaneotrichosporon spelunceum TaxID=1672016 RepID=A0AAD3YE15_9TREE|nr:hypothetical protein CspeluHIS016_0505560 [Cutaneotrichosporon spelunceum]
MSGIDSPQGRDSYLTAASSQASSSRSHSPLPIEGTSGGKPRRKLSLFRPHHRGRSTPSPMVSGPEDEDDEWLLEGGTHNGRVDPDASMGREASTLSRSIDTLSIESVQAAPRVEKRDSRGKRLAKKTSRLFHRAAGSNSTLNGHNDAASAHAPPLAASNLPIPLAGRQSSFSSSASSNETGASRKWANLARVHSRESPIHRSSGESSQPSSWQYHSNTTVRRASSSTNGDSVHGMNIQTLRPRESSGQLSQYSTSAPHTARPPMIQPPPNAQSQAASGRGWFSNLLGSGEQTGSPQQQDVTATPPSPLRKGPGFLTGAFAAVRNKAANGLRTLVDSDAQPDHCQEAMWVMGVAHPGWTPVSDDPFYNDSLNSGELSSPWATRLREGSGTLSTPPAKLSTIFGSSFNIAAQAEGPSTPSPDAAARYRKDKAGEKEVLKWPEQFYDDFRSRVWCTYRSNYAPILPFQENTLLPTPRAYYGAFSTSEHAPPVPPSNIPPAGRGGGGWLRGETHYTSDSGWGCMLRTGQSMLANALIHVHLGRGWRLPPERPKLHPETLLELAELEAYATHVRILSWFLDDPSPLCPFSVHRMAMIGKELGKEVGQWFGPSTAAGALRSLANSFPICGLSVVSAQDGSIYKADVYAASNTTTDGWEPVSPRKARPTSAHRSSWGNHSVLILVATRLGLDNVNPVYYDSVKSMFTWPQSVGIAGGRPDSSYYFVASQADHLFYLDPHYTRPAVPPRVPPLSAATGEPIRRDSWSDHPLEADAEHEPEALPQSPAKSGYSMPVLGVVDVDKVEESPARVRRSRRLTPMQQSLRIDPQTPPRMTNPPSPTTPTLSAPRPSGSVQASPGPSRHAAHSSIPSSVASSLRARLPVDPQTQWYASAYSEDKLRTFHCDRVKKLPLSGLDPSMLLGFLVQSEAEFEDFCDRVAKLPQKIFIVQDEAQSWSDDDDGALESVSEGISGPEMDSDEEDDDDPDNDASEMLSGEGVEVVEFGRVGPTSAPSATFPPRSGQTTRQGVAPAVLSTPDTSLDMSMWDSDDEAMGIPTLTARSSFATIPRKPSYSSDVPTLKAHMRGASTSAVPHASHSRVSSMSATVLAHRRTASAQPSPQSRNSSMSGSRSSGSISRSRGHSRRSSSPPLPFGPSPVVTARRPPPISVPDGTVILPPPRSVSLSAPTSARRVEAIDTSGIPRLLDPVNPDSTEELISMRPSLEFGDETETLETAGAETPDEEESPIRRHEDRQGRRTDEWNEDEGLSHSYSPPVSPPELPLSPSEGPMSLPRSQAQILPRSHTQETVMPRSATQETVRPLPRAVSQHFFDEEWEEDDREEVSSWDLGPSKKDGLDSVREK